VAFEAKWMVLGGRKVVLETMTIRFMYSHKTTTSKSEKFTFLKHLSQFRVKAEKPGRNLENGQNKSNGPTYEVQQGLLGCSSAAA
jgi:hypothetical protein